ncbi:MULTISPECIES: hypothetical protein [unclassified Breznakia]|uniref:hypothetical protein n=1 Tax=unclassified Breznakia TaxID=2623764 RepID=UPI00240501A0|nr:MULTISPECIES: hypothetical protein [unclassified Breznakia]
MFRRIHWNNRGCKSIVWRCISKLEPMALSASQESSTRLTCRKLYSSSRMSFLEINQNIASVIRASTAITTDGIDEKLMELQQELVKCWLKQIIIWPTHCTVELKFGFKVDVER